MNETVCQLNEFLKELKTIYGKRIASMNKRIMFLLDEKNFLPKISVKIDGDVLRKIIDVLVDNAVKYTDKGYIKIGYRILDNNVLQLFVEDTGVGFDPEVLEETTQSFSKIEGTSSDLDASNLKDIIKLANSINAKIHIESQKDMGTVVYLSVSLSSISLDKDADDPSEPVSSHSDNAFQKSKADTMTNIWKGKTILIAEDELVNYMFLEVLFEETGAVLIHAADGQQAIDAVKANPDINLVLMDIKMPNINGLDATKAIKALRPQLPVIAQTAYAMQDDEYKALQAGCNDYISKPIDANKLISLMKKYLW
ncbi:MAG: response regulator [Bacteroidales bacterium]|jgi:CheY-like chemotaxis protein|nr:response regulator [Bacteroidales bacterium]